MKAAIRQLQRRQLLERIYDKMSEEERKTFVRLTLEDRSGEQIMEALRKQSLQLDDIKRKKQSFVLDFASNVAGNAAYDTALWLLRRLVKLV